MNGLKNPRSRLFIHQSSYEVTERQRDRETERQRDREAERQRDRETERQRDREVDSTKRLKETHRETGKQTDR